MKGISDLFGGNLPTAADQFKALQDKIKKSKGEAVDRKVESLLKEIETIAADILKSTEDKKKFKSLMSDLRGSF